MELRQLEAFVAVATELHFGRAAERLNIGQPTVSELVRRLERELGTALLLRTTRRVSLTHAGTELLARATSILDEVAAARSAIRTIAEGDAGVVRLGMTPPVAPTLAPYLVAALEREAHGVDLESRRLWFPDLTKAVAEGNIDVALTCGHVVDVPAGVVTAVFCGEPLMAGLRQEHPCAEQKAVDLHQLSQEVLGFPDAALFPAWAMAQEQILERLAIAPPRAALDVADLTAGDWPAQSEVTWVLLTRSVGAVPAGTVARPVEPPQAVPFTILWNVQSARAATVARFVRLALSVDPPPGWLRGPQHAHHGTGDHAGDMD